MLSPRTPGRIGLPNQRLGRSARSITMPAQSLLADLRNVAFRYGRHLAWLLEDVSLQVHRGEIALLAGPNGSGKSTLLGLLSGRLVPTAGTVRVFSNDPAKVSRAPDIGIISEPFHPEQSPLPVDLSVQQVFDWLRVLDGATSEAIENEWAGLGLLRSLRNHPVRILSKGERQRVMLLVVLLRRPRLILADEPLEGLDRESRQLIGERLRNYANVENAGVLWVSHHLSETLEYADRLLTIENRRVVEEPPGRFRVQLCTSGREPARFRLVSLQALPDLVARHVDGHGRVQLDIEDTTCKKEPL